MSTYKERFVLEHEQCRDRANKLENMLECFERGTLDFVPTCPISLLYEQLEVMRHYQAILEERAQIEDVELTEV